MSHLESTFDDFKGGACVRVERSTLFPKALEFLEDDAGGLVLDSIARLYSTISHEAFWDMRTTSVGVLLTEQLVALRA